MIGNPVSTLAAASKLSPQQLNQSTQDGVVPGGIAQIISQARGAEQQNMTPPPSPPPTGTVADSIMQGVAQSSDPLTMIDHKIKELSKDTLILQDAIKDGKVPSYVGIPKLAEQVQQLNAMKAVKAQLEGQQAAQEMPQQFPMQTAPQQNTQGIDAAQSNLPQQGYAPGGIVAFADGGGMPQDDPEYDPSKSDPSEFGGLSNAERALISRFRQPAQAAQEAAQEAAQAAPQDIGSQDQQDTIAMTGAASPFALDNSMASATGGAGAGIASLVSKGGEKAHKYQDSILAAAKRYRNVDPRIALTIARLETGNMKSPETAVSKAGAMGVMQVKPATAAAFGVKKEDLFNPEVNIDTSMRLLSQVTDKYNGDPALILAAYNAGEPKLNRAIASGKGINSMKPETRNYVSKGMSMLGGEGYDEGGAVKRFTNTGAVEDDMGLPDSPYGTDISSVAPTVDPTSIPWHVGMSYAEYQKLAQKANIARAAPSATSAEPYAYFQNLPGMTEGDYAVIPRGAVSNDLISALYAAPAAPAAPAAAPAASDTPDATSDPIMDYLKQAINAKSEYSDEFKKNIAEQKAQLSEQQKMAPWLALMGAGAGMMGRSNFGIVNLGEGLKQGIGTYGVLQQMADRQQQGITQTLLGAERADLLQKERALSAAGILEARMARVKQAEDMLAAQKGHWGNVVDVQRGANMAKIADARARLETTWPGSTEEQYARASIKKPQKDWNTADWATYRTFHDRYVNPAGIAGLSSANTGIQKATDLAQP